MRRGQGNSTQTQTDAIYEGYPTNSSILERPVDRENVTSAIPPTKIGSIEPMK